MITALTLTLKLKQDDRTKATIQQLQESLFETQVQPKIDAALRRFKGVHFARVVLIEDQYLQVITEFDGDQRIYTDFFRRELGDVFQTIFSLADGAPPWDAIDNEEAFFELAKSHNIRPLGKSVYEGNPDGYVFMAQHQRSVKDISESLNLSDQVKGVRDFIQS